ncbi:MAG: hypothetical protein LBV69_00740 [Bacteroidales bacterium]|jgi:hypothetical protein|nr:hypothetical protein [Bacteroidales bacterium]
MKTYIKVKKSFLIIMLLSVFTTSFSQKLQLGIESGITKPVFSISNAGWLWNNNDWFFGIKNIDLKLNYYFKNNIFVSIAIDYNLFYDNVNLVRPGTNYSGLYRYVSAPISVGYKLQLFSSSFYLKYSAGIDLCFMFDHSYGDKSKGKINTENIEYDFYYNESSYIRNFNILLNQRLSLTYEIKKFMYIDLFAEYHGGLMKVIDASGTIIYRSVSLLDNDEIAISTQTYHPVITSNGSYWRIGLGIGYIFKNREKK